jgi:hypothetical protein
MTKKAIILSAVCLTIASYAGAESQYLDFMLTRYNIPNGSKLNSCTTCHSQIGGGWPRNAYGDQLQTAGIGGTTQAMTDAFDATDPLDADNDDAANWVELVNGTWPADPTDFVPVDNGTWGRIKALFN